MQTIEVNGVKYIPENKSEDIRIVVLQRGWVYVGRFNQNDKECFLTDCACIRIWGTDSSKPGLGYIAENGPTDKTKLDKCPTVRFNELTVINTIDCVGEKWKSHLN